MDNLRLNANFFSWNFYVTVVLFGIVDRLLAKQ